MGKKWTGQIERTDREVIEPKVTDELYLQFGHILKKVKKYAPRCKGKLLDVGAGKSPYKKFFKNATEYVKMDCFEYEGLDIVADITKKTPIKSESYDSVICLQVLEHVNEPQKAVDEMHRILKKGGSCLLTTHMAAPLHGEPHDYFRFTDHGLRHIFRNFSKVEVKPDHGAVMALIQLIILGFTQNLPRPIAWIFSVPLNLIAGPLDKLVYNPVFTLNYSVYAVK